MSAQLRAELRNDEREWIEAAAQRWAHERRLDDVVREYAARGDRVAVEVAGTRFEGHIDAVGDDRLDLRTATRAVTVRTALDPPRRVLAPLVVRRVVPARAGGRRLPPALVTFRARLLELEAQDARVAAGSLLFPSEVVGTLAVGRDHVVVTAAAEIVIPACWLAYVAVEDSGAAA